MSLTGKLQGIAARGYRLRWSVDPTSDPDYDRLTLALLDAKGDVVLSNSQRVKARGGVVTKESEEAQKNALVTWAEGVTRSPIQPPPNPKDEVPAAGPPAPASDPEPAPQPEPTPVAAAEGQEVQDG